MKYPEIRIINAWLLREKVSVPLHELWAKKGDKLADNEWMEWKVGEYKKAWEPYEHKIIQAMYDITGLEFRQSVIDVYIAPWFSAISNPMVIGVIYGPDVFVDTLTHELLHRLLTDNTLISYETDLLPEWKKLFGKQHSFVTTVHIPVHAVHKAICLDILKAPERIQRDIKMCKDHNSINYVKSWDYVNKHDYKEIIEKLKNNYAKLKLNRA